MCLILSQVHLASFRERGRFTAARSQFKGMTAGALRLRGTAAQHHPCDTLTRGAAERTLTRIRAIDMIDRNKRIEPVLIKRGGGRRP
ncbi:hypothetical protein NITHO_2270005 [Nitrolancea hollandica Lb]|uniref:Uncharacterized protein n=1 Tax=Nitrolancea hollandica Lb TaxID=1129897 RepID=I4EFC6_9BACT|nr:hypothetical protein NITHO_2270005 [Nitrolancea hollandica Lb]